jgi:hypothetical protein
VGNACALLDKIGSVGLLALVWRSTPFPLRCIAFPYGFFVYRKLLRASLSVAQLYSVHSEMYASSLAFRLLRPRYHKMASLLVRFEENREMLPANVTAPKPRDARDIDKPVEESPYPDFGELDAPFAGLFTTESQTMCGASAPLHML